MVGAQQLFLLGGRLLAQHNGLRCAVAATITVMPFTSSLLGGYPGNPLAVDVFAANLLLAVVATRVMFVLGRRWGLLAGDITARDVWALRARAAAIVIVVAVSAALAWVSPTAAKHAGC